MSVQVKIGDKFIISRPDGRAEKVGTVRNIEDGRIWYDKIVVNVTPFSCNVNQISSLLSPHDLNDTGFAVVEEEEYNWHVLTLRSGAIRDQFMMQLASYVRCLNESDKSDMEELIVGELDSLLTHRPTAA